MEPPRALGLGLHTRSHHQTPSTAPASPTDEPPEPKMKRDALPAAAAADLAMPPQHSTVAHMSFGPATQQTVVTTTTTTTVALPPLVMKPPKDLYERDPKQFPLAFSPTPHSIKRFCFDVNGRPTVFHEAEDADDTMRRYHRLQAKMQRHHGAITKEDRQEKPYYTPERPSDARPPRAQLHNVRASDAPKRSATPSIAEAAELASLHRKAKRPRSRLHSDHSELDEQPSINQRLASGTFPPAANPSPVTPDADSATVSVPRPRLASQRHEDRLRNGPAQLARSKLRELHDEDGDDEGDTPMVAADAGLDNVLLGPPFHEQPKGKQSFADPRLLAGATATPPIGETDLDLLQPPVQDDVRRRPVLPGILTSSQQDASLPSPSLSPITAAANLASRQNQFDLSFAEESASVVSGLDLDNESKTASAPSVDPQRSGPSSRPRFQFTHGAPQQQQPSPPFSGPSVMDIPNMVDAFDSMPEALQSYVMYQFLRRCPKPTLQMVANVVNPALKCDPFNVLPTELGSIITRFFDAKTMCRAAQVSKKWRRIVNSDERAWKDLLDRDEFVLPKNEIVRAVKEGWGWQHPGEDGAEEDLDRASDSVPSSPPEPSAGLLSDDDEATSSTATSRSKRRIRARHASSGKGKRSLKQIVTLSKGPPPLWKRMLAQAQGPTAYANAALHAVPHPTVGLESLRSMHLFKSLYQRHHLIRKAWMNDEAQPQHLAFRAHHRHVVTCLLFDSDKILTGSDDTKINVYDTKTGALRTRLEGHEGGVWALQYEGDTLVSGSTDRSVRIWDIKTGRCLQVFQGHTSTVRCLVILKPVQIDTAPDGSPVMMPKEPLIITGSRDSTLRVWKLPQPGDRSIIQAGPPANDRDNPYFLRTLSGHHNSVRAIAAHGDTLVSGSYDCTVRVWRISNGDLVHRLQGHTQKVYSVVLDHKRNRCISGSMDNLVKVWDLHSGTALFNLEGHTSLVGLLDLSHDRLVSAAADSTLRIWDPETGACKATLSAHTGAITCFQHDSQKVISGSDRTLKMWNVRNGECVRDLLTDLSGVWQVRFDERRCVAAVQRNQLTYIEVSRRYPRLFTAQTADREKNRSSTLEPRATASRRATAAVASSSIPSARRSMTSTSRLSPAMRAMSPLELGDLVTSSRRRLGALLQA